MILKNIVKRKKEFLKTHIFEEGDYEYKKNSLYEQLKKENLSIIGEIKRASPSKNDINLNINLSRIVKEYNLSVDAISVLTENDFFKGDINDLKEAKRESTIPILRKDFIVSKEQILESKRIGADAILLITSILTEIELKEYYEYAMKLNLDVIIEVHNKIEVEMALRINPRIIGINNRDLKTFRIDINITNRLRKLIPSNIIVVSESGILTYDDVKKLECVDAILVGESFMKSQNISKHSKELKNAYKSKN
jgi:indole-3-glycerol phosphate synthase